MIIDRGLLERYLGRQIREEEYSEVDAGGIPTARVRREAPARESHRTTTISAQRLEAQEKNIPFSLALPNLFLSDNKPAFGR